MKVMFLNASDIDGGAARGALRLLHGVREEGVEARLLVQRKTGDDPFVIGPQTNPGKVMAFVRPGLESLYVGLCAGQVEGMYSPALVPDSLPAKTAEFNPDIVHLHWVANGMMRVETLRRFNRPLVWTLHDSWAFTGGCHVPLDCTRYRESCGQCPVLGSSRQHDLSRRLWRRKQRAWHGLDLTVVTPSRWLAECARSSSLFRDTRIEVIPNGLDLRRFKPVDRRIARDLLSLPQERKLILFGGKWITNDRNKGFHLLGEALRGLAGRRGDSTTEVVVFGSSEPAQPPDLGLKTHYLGWLHDDVSIALLYAAADLFVSPSIQENLSYAVMEAMACGTPCVAFDQGGMPDLIDHGRNGYLARPFEPDDLAQGIAWVLADEDRRQALSAEARRKVENEFARERVARRYVDLYGELVGQPA
jgi:glycosyltransferase involved in cell wall biosynthesis